MMMKCHSNKRIGTEFEQEMCGLLAADGWWVHFITPNAAGAQPFDVIAVKNGEALALDCKTCEKDSISYSRLEDNQKLAMEHWIRKGNRMPMVAVKHRETVYMVSYLLLKTQGSVRLTEDFEWTRTLKDWH